MALPLTIGTGQVESFGTRLLDNAFAAHTSSTIIRIAVLGLIRGIQVRGHLTDVPTHAASGHLVDVPTHAARAGEPMHAVYETAARTLHTLWRSCVIWSSLCTLNTARFTFR